MQNASEKQYYLAIIWPFAGLVNCLKNWREPGAKNIFWIVCIYMGAVFIFHPTGTTLGIGKDSGRYVQQLQYMYHNVDSFSDVSSNFYNGVTNDIYGPTLQYIVSRITDNGHFFFFVVAIIFGFFYSRNIWYILDRISDQYTNWMWIIIAAFIFVCPIREINAFRMWTAAQVFVYGTMPYLLEGEKKNLIWSFSSILIHHSFIFPIILLSIFILLFEKLVAFDKTLFVLFCFYAFSLTINTLDLESINNLLQNYLPSYYENRVNGYVSESYLENKIELASHNSWHVAFFSNIQFWVCQIFILFSFLLFKQYKQELDHLLPLFCFSLLFLGIANICACVPSGIRYVEIARMFMFAVFLLLYEDMHYEEQLEKYFPSALLILAFSLFFDIRKMFDYYGLSMFVGNFFSALFYDDNTPMIDYIKFL